MGLEHLSERQRQALAAHVARVRKEVNFCTGSIQAKENILKNNGFVKRNGTWFPPAALGQVSLHDGSAPSSFYKSPNAAASTTWKTDRQIEARNRDLRAQAEEPLRDAGFDDF